MRAKSIFAATASAVIDAGLRQHITKKTEMSRPSLITSVNEARR